MDSLGRSRYVQPWPRDHGSQVFEIVLCYFIRAGVCSMFRKKKKLLLFKISRLSPTLHFAQVQPTLRLSPIQATQLSLQTAHTSKQAPKTQEAHTVGNAHMGKETGLLICSQAGGLSPECRRDIAAVKGEIAQPYLPSTDQGGIPKTRLIQLINLPRFCLSQPASFQVHVGLSHFKKINKVKL